MAAHHDQGFGQRGDVNESPRVTAFQEEVARVFFALPEARSFLLAGGLALLAHGMSFRPTEVMDAFTSQPADVSRASQAFQAAAAIQAWQVEILRSADTFVRLHVRGTEALIVDIALDSPPGLPASMSFLGPTFAPDELAARKLLALFGRAMPRDFVDVYRVTRERTTSDLMNLARSIDPGLNDHLLSVALNQLTRYTDDQLLIDRSEVDALRNFFAEWSRTLSTDH